MFRSKYWFATALAAMLLLPAVAEAQRSPFDPAAILRNPRALARYLRLTEAQVQQQRTLLQELRETVEPLRAQQRPLQEDLREALEVASPNACTVGGIVVQIDAIGDDIREAHEEFDEAFSAILTAEQRARYEALKDAAREFAAGD